MVRQVHRRPDRRGGRATSDQVDGAVRGALASFERERLDGQRDTRSCTTPAGLIASRRRDFVERIVAEAGFPCPMPTTRSAGRFNLPAVRRRKPKRLTGEMVPIENAPGTRTGCLPIRVPRGVVCGISRSTRADMVAHRWRRHWRRVIPG